VSRHIIVKDRGDAPPSLVDGVADEHELARLVPISESAHGRHRDHFGHAELPQSDQVAHVVDLVRWSAVARTVAREQDHLLVANLTLAEPDVAEVSSVVPPPTLGPFLEHLEMAESRTADDADFTFHDFLLKWRQKRHWLS